MLENLYKIDWGRLGDPYIPQWIERLTSPEEETRRKAIYIVTTIVIDGDALDLNGRIPYALSSDIAAHVIPFLIELLGYSSVETDVKVALVADLDTLARYYAYFKDRKRQGLTEPVLRAKQIYELVRGGADTYRKLLYETDLDLKQYAAGLLNYVLVREIEDAFKTVEYPDDDYIVQNPEYAEPYEMLQAFKGKHWSDITLEMAEYWRMNTGSLPPKAFHYFVPAFLIAGLHEDSAEVDLYLMYQFIPPDENAKSIEFNERFSEFDESQREAISKFIMRFLDNNALYYDDDRKKRIQSFWKIPNS